MEAEEEDSDAVGDAFVSLSFSLHLVVPSGVLRVRSITSVGEDGAMTTAYSSGVTVKKECTREEDDASSIKGATFVCGGERGEEEEKSVT